MSDNAAPLGFEIDTKSLDLAFFSAQKLKAALEGVATATDKQAEAARRALDAQRREALAMQGAADAADKKRRANEALQAAMVRTGQGAQTVGQTLTGLQQSLMGIGQGMTSPQGIVSGMNGMVGATARLAPMLGGLGAGVGLLTAGVGALTVAYSAALAATVKQQEQYLIFEARLKNVYGSAAAAKEVFRDLTELADRNGIAVSATADSFLRLARNNEAIGLTRDQMIDLTDAVQKLGRVSGASQGELSSGLLQFSQALAAGKLNGDELRSIMENMPALAKAIAEGLGVSVGQMRAMGAEGQLTSDKIVNSLLGQLPKISKEFEGLPDTTAEAFTRVGNSWERLLANMGQQLDASGILTKLGNGLADVVGFAADAVAPQTQSERIIEMAETMRLATQEGGYGVSGPSRRAVSEARQMVADPAFQAEYQSLIAQQRMDREQKALQEARTQGRAAFVRSGSAVTDLADTETKVKKLTETINTLSTAYADFQKNPGLFEDEEIAKLEKYPGYIAALRTQLANALPVLDEYQRRTEEMAADTEKFGFGGAAAIGEEMRKLVTQAAAKGQDLAAESALAAVLRRRVTEVGNQTGGLQGQIEAQQRLIDVVGKGVQAQMDAEIATEAYNLQMKMFGTNVGPEAERVLQQYTDKLRELKEIQREVTDAQKLYNAELELGNTLQINAAIAAGASAGEIEALRRAQGLNQSIGSISPVGSARDVTLRGGTQIPSNMMSAFDAASRVTGIPVNILAAIAKTESGFNPNAVSPTGARGVMQVLPSTARDPGYGVAGVNPEDLFHPTTNIMFGARYLKGRANSLGITDFSDPAQLRTLLRAYSGADTPMGDKNYDTKVLGNLGTGVQAAVVSGQVAEAQSLQAGLTRLQQLKRELAELEARTKAPDAITRRNLEIEQQADAAAREVNPSQAAEVRAATVAKMRAEDEAAAMERKRALEQEVRLTEQQLKIAGLTGREREIELEVLQRINEELNAGRAVDEGRAQEIREAVALKFDNNKRIQEAQEEADKLTDIYQTAADGIGSALENALSQAMKNGKIEAEDILSGLVQDITMSIFKAYVTKPLTDSIMSFLSAHGNAFSGGEVVPFAMGGLVDRPTIFPMARGAGLMGEAGPEAVLPLKRGPDGRLGVGAGSGGGGTMIVINDMRQAPGAEPVETEEKEGPDGQRLVQILVRDEVRRQVKSGELDTEMRGTYGLTRQITRR